jgi:DNA-binding NarL/FixJ family response regulator
MSSESSLYPAADDELEAALRRVLAARPAGQRGPAILTRLVIDGEVYTVYREPLNGEAGLEALLTGLSRREAEVARLAALGLSAKAIAQALNIRPYTVDTYIRRLYQKLNINSRAALANVLARHPL